MQELNQYLRWCDDRYENLPHCNCGNNCTNNHYCKGQQTDCYACIKRVHDYHNQIVHYNCEKMLYYYVLKHCYRFGAEVFFEINKISRDLASWSDIHYVSIGCGPCCELFGAILQWRTMGKEDCDFHFRGFDTGRLWGPLMNKACECCNTVDVSVYNQNVFRFYEDNQEQVDIIVLNYMLSDMKKFHASDYNSFLADLVALIRQKRPRYLLINDIYLLVSVEASRELLKHLTDGGVSFKHIKLQYSYLHPVIGQFGHQISKQPYSMSDALIVRKYDPFREVNSIQTIIKFQ